jgi:hypothetical protein
MKLFRPLAGLCVFALAAIPAFAQHGGGSSSGHSSGGGGSHFSSGGGHSSGGGASVHAYSGSSYSAGSADRAGGFGGARGSSETYTYPGTGMHATGAGGSAFTNNGGIRFSDFGLEETPRFTASMIPSRPAATASPAPFQIATRDETSEHEKWDRMGHSGFDHGDRGFYRFRHSGFFFFGLFGAPFCDPLGSADYGQSFVYDNLSNNDIGCYGQNLIGDEQDYAPGDEADAGSPDDAAAPDENSSDESKDAEPPDTLLQLKDGSMYGLTAYWVEGGELHYVTNYGGANAIPLDRIDLAKTVQLNASRGQAFVLQEKSAARNAAH